jgi:phosphate transport system substrate-binding protein
MKSQGKIKNEEKQMLKLNKKLLTGLLTAATCLTVGTSVSAQDAQINLKSVDGSASLQGNLIEFVDGFYTIDTDLGRFRVSAARMTCEGDACPTIIASDANVIFAGSDTIGLGLMPLLLTGFANTQGAEIDVRNGTQAGEVIADVIGDEGFGDKIGQYLISSKTSSAAFTALADKSATIGMASRRITRDEARILKTAGAGSMVSADSERVIAVDSIVVIVHPSNPVSRISFEQLAAIYSGEISNWNQIGGSDQVIAPFTRSENSATRGTFERAIFAQSRGKIGSSIESVGTNNDMAAAVNADQGGIGYVGFAFQRGAKPLNLTNTCGITVSPTTFSAKTEEYPMGQRMYLYNRTDNLPPEASDFLAYAQSQDADGVIAKSGFIDLGVERLSQNFTGNRMQEIINNTSDQFELGLMRELLVEMLQWERLSTTLRFKSGSSRLDRKAENDVKRLIDYLESLPLGAEVAVVGFTDSDGAFEANRGLSINRSAEAAKAIQALAAGRLSNVKFVSKGFGELSPAACNTSGAGKAINRRVEVWVRTPS